MPNYEYQCTACQNVFEIWQSVGEAAPPCPECGEAVKKVFHPPRVIFKGSGFYVTDLRAEKAGSAQSGTKSSSSSTSSTASSSDSAISTEKTETKPTESASAPSPSGVTSTSGDKAKS